MEATQPTGAVPAQTFIQRQLGYGKKLWKDAKAKRPAQDSSKRSLKPVSMELSDFSTPGHSRGSSCSSEGELQSS